MEDSQALEILLVIAIVLLALMQLALGITLLVLLKRIRRIAKNVDATIEAGKAAFAKGRFLPALARYGVAGIKTLRAKRA